ncbi:unnamed protein product [Paramecium primaurelia]|uniref:RING-type domain-containing protein n=1 Tax=Paramecium primaurelia TaxID=5886 RepID=A0A8S1KE34_PARPR|nr:unnamed protein product [Paramecium primaurelia]
MYFECPCSFRKELEQESQIIEHIDICQEFNIDSPLCNMYKRANVEEISIEQLVTFLCDLKLQVERIENVLKIRGFRKKIMPIISDLNFDHCSKSTSSSKIKKNNVGIQQNNIVVRILQKTNSSEQQSFKINQESLNQDNQLNLTSSLSTHQYFEDEKSSNLIIHQTKEIIQDQLIINCKQQQDEKIACEACRKTFYFNQDFEKLWFLENCGHVMCKLCIHRLALEKYVENDGRIMCQEIGCIAWIKEFELKQILGIDKFNDLDQKLAFKNQDIIECIKCKSQFFFEKGNPKEIVKDQQGKNINHEAQINYANNRFICKQCKTEQCRECKAVPFHIGMTCQEYKINSQANKCILCNFPCEGKVCNQDDCQKRFQRLCQNKLDCGHSCNGVKGEECLCLICSNQEPDDYCNMCFIEPLKSAPCIKTECGHIFHEECIFKKLDSKWNGYRIIFNYFHFAICTKEQMLKKYQQNNQQLSYVIQNYKQRELRMFQKQEALEKKQCQLFQTQILIIVLNPHPVQKQKKIMLEFNKIILQSESFKKPILVNNNHLKLIRRVQIKIINQIQLPLFQLINILKMKNLVILQFIKQKRQFKTNQQLIVNNNKMKKLHVKLVEKHFILIKILKSYGSQKIVDMQCVNYVFIDWHQKNMLKMMVELCVRKLVVQLGLKNLNQNKYQELINLMIQIKNQHLKIKILLNALNVNLNSFLKKAIPKKQQKINKINYANNRFICKQCKTEQCRECKAVPFHIGMTCQEYKINSQANKCILCNFPCEGKVCNQDDCQKRFQRLCQNKLDCGHSCNGVKGEECLCLICSNQEPDDYCNMCFIEPLKSAPCIKTECGHIFHEECIFKKLDSKWNGYRIIFNYCTCPLCKKFLDIKHKEIKNKINEALQLKLHVQELCLERLHIEGMKQAQELIDPKSQYYQKPQEFAMDKFCFYECFKCKKPYFGGIKNCQANTDYNERTQFNKEDLICPSCCPISFEDICNQHGDKYIEFKCRFCCSVAVWFCGGTTHYCEPCHSGRNPNMNKPCPGLEKCPLRINHKPTGQENALGCALCRTKRFDDILKQN